MVEQSPPRERRSGSLAARGWVRRKSFPINALSPLLGFGGIGSPSKGISKAPGPRAGLDGSPRDIGDLTMAEPETAEDSDTTPEEAVA